VLGVAGAIAAVVATRQDDAAGSDATDDATTPVRAVEATQRDLAEVEEVDGTFSYGDATTVSAGTTGTVTALVDVGDELARGDVAYELDTVPVVVLWGDTPLYRELRRGVDDGRDVRILEENLAALGYDADGELTVDETFDADTEDAVEEWQDDVGAVVDGVVQPSEVIVLAGPATVRTVDTQVGATVNQGTPVVSATISHSTTTVLARADGSVTSLPAAGTPFATGDVAYELDSEPVPVVIGDEPLSRELSADSDDGADITQLEAALVELGYDADGALEVDGTFDDATTWAVTEWEQDLGLELVDGIVQLGQYVVIPTDSRLLTTTVAVGDEVAQGAELYLTGVSNRRVTGSIPTDDADLLAVGGTVTVEFPDGTTAGATITSIDSVTTTSADGESTTGFDVVLDEIPDSVADRDELDITIEITSRLAEGATVVPANALVSVGDGTYAVEVVAADGTSTTFVAVEPGLFADGDVEVTGIEPGTAVVVPE
jgi:peptidoglycan hydrolase-like protein with peptidoglycan-binding domain